MMKWWTFSCNWLIAGDRPHLEGYLPGMVRAADLVLLCFDGSSDDAPEQTGTVIAPADRKTPLDDARVSRKRITASFTSRRCSWLPTASILECKTDSISSLNFR